MENPNEKTNTQKNFDGILLVDFQDVSIFVLDFVFNCALCVTRNTAYFDSRVFAVSDGRQFKSRSRIPSRVKEEETETETERGEREEKKGTLNK